MTLNMELEYLGNDNHQDKKYIIFFQVKWHITLSERWELSSVYEEIEMRKSVRSVVLVELQNHLILKHSTNHQIKP